MNFDYGDYVEVSEKGHLVVDGCDLVEIAKEFGTPVYAYSENILRQNYNRMEKAFSSLYPNVQLSFACKANNLLAVMKILQQEGAGLDANGPAELYKGMLAGFSPEKIVFNGNNKSAKYIKMAIDLGVPINVDNEDELTLIEEIATYSDEPAIVNLRLSISPKKWENLYLSDYRIDLHRHKFHGKFGIPYTDAFKVAKRVIKMKNVKWTGMHSHIKSQATDPWVFKPQIEEMIRIMAELRETFSVNFKCLDIGGGYPIARKNYGYGPNKITEVPSIDEYASIITTTLKTELKKHGLGDIMLIMEPGRYLVAQAGFLLSTVGNVKKLLSGETMASVDATTMSLLWTLTTSWYHHPVVANKANHKPIQKVNVAGPLCWGVDWFAKEVDMPEIKKNDIISFLDSGAYAENMANAFNGFEIPGSVLLKNGDAFLIKKREDVYDLVGKEALPTHLLNKCRVINC